MSATDFYLTLSSASSAEHFPQNTLTDFSIKLPKEIHLSGNWQVGLSDLIFPYRFLLNPQHFSVDNIKEDLTGQHTINLYTELRSFETKEDFIAHLNEVLTKAELRKALSFSINGQGYVSVRVKGGYQVTLNEGLSHILGFREGAVPMAKVIVHEFSEDGRRTVNRLADVRCMFPLHPLVCVHSNIVESNVVGDRLERVLDIVPVANHKKEERIFVHSVERPRYIPLRWKTLSTLRVELKTGEGDHLPLLAAGEGSTIIKLHFKRV